MTPSELMATAVAGFVHGGAEAVADLLNNGNLKVPPRRTRRNKRKPRHTQLHISRFDTLPGADEWYYRLREDYRAGRYDVVVRYGPFFLQVATGMIKEATYNTILSARLHLGQDTEAIELGRQALLECDDDEVWVLVRSNLAIALNRSGARHEAEQVLSDILLRFPNSFHALINLLCIASLHGDEQACWNRAEAFLKSFPEASKSGTELSKLLENEEDLSFFRTTRAFQSLCPSLRGATIAESVVAFWDTHPWVRLSARVAVVTPPFLVLLAKVLFAAVVSG